MLEELWLEELRVTVLPLVEEDVDVDEDVEVDVDESACAGAASTRAVTKARNAPVFICVFIIFGYCA